MDKDAAQALAQEILKIGGGMESVGEVVLSDDDQTAVEEGQTVTTPTRLEWAADQSRLVTGDSYDVDEIVDALDWA